MDSYLLLLSDRLTLLLFGLIVGAVLFGPHTLYRKLGLHRPAERMGIWMDRIAQKLNRSHRSVATRVYRGIILLLFFAALAVLTGVAVLQISAFASWVQWLEILFITYLIPLRPLYSQVATIRRRLQRDAIDKARECAGEIGLRDHTRLAAHGLRRVSLEYLATRFSDAIIAPVCWYLLLGLPGLLLLRMVDLIDRQIGQRNEAHLAFGWAAAKLEDIMMLIPARLSALFIVLAAFFVPKGKPLGALRTLISQARKTISPNNGWLLAGFAGALNISLGGPHKQRDWRVEDAWIGPGSAKIEDDDLRRGITLYVVAVLLMLLSMLLTLALLTNVEFSVISDLAQRV